MSITRADLWTSLVSVGMRQVVTPAGKQQVNTNLGKFELLRSAGFAE